MKREHSSSLSLNFEHECRRERESLSLNSAQDAEPVKEQALFYRVSMIPKTSQGTHRHETNDEASNNTDRESNDFYS